MSDQSNYIQIGPHRIHRRYGTEHLLLVGGSGSGKTVLTKSLLGSVLRTPLDLRALIYDAKEDLLPTIYQLCEESEQTVASGNSRVKVLNPFDFRAVAWDIARDIDTPAKAEQTSNILVADRAGPGEDDFFLQAARAILTANQVALINCPPNAKSWTFRDLMLTALYEPYTRFILNLAVEHESPPLMMAGRVIDQFLDCDPRTASNIRATISALLSPFEPIAACWDKARKGGRTFSIAEWSRDTSQDILVLGNDETARSSLDIVNRAIFKRATELLLGRREISAHERDTGNNQSWVVLDEVREAGKLDGLGRLLTKGRSKGACVVLAYQDIEGLRDVYGEHVANELSAQCSNAVFLRINSPSTAAWAADSFGSGLQAVRNSAFSTGKEGTNHSHGRHDEERPLLYTSDFLYLPPAGKENGISGFYRMSGFQPMSRQEALGHISGRDLPSFIPDVKEPQEGSWLSSFMPRPDRDQYMRPWDAEDMQRLGFSCAPPPWRKRPGDEGPSISEIMQSYLDASTRRP